MPLLLVAAAAAAVAGIAAVVEEGSVTEVQKAEAKTMAHSMRKEVWRKRIPRLA